MLIYMCIYYTVSSFFPSFLIQLDSAFFVSPVRRFAVPSLHFDCSLPSFIRRSSSSLSFRCPLSCTYLLSPADGRRHDVRIQFDAELFSVADFVFALAAPDALSLAPCADAYFGILVVRLCTSSQYLIDWIIMIVVC